MTKVSSESFGSMSDEDATAQLEIRASWTPVSEPLGDSLGGPAADGLPHLEPHVEAWGELICTASGLPPVPEGVAHAAKPARTARPRLMPQDATEPESRAAARPVEAPSRTAPEPAPLLRAA